MQPIAVECSKYYLENNINLFSIDISCIYPRTQELTSSTMMTLTTDLLSKNDILIKSAEHTLTNIFNIPINWFYMALSRAEKSQLHLHTKIESTILSNFSTSKKINSCYYCPPYCFVK